MIWDNWLEPLSKFFLSWKKDIALSERFSNSSKKQLATVHFKLRVLFNVVVASYDCTIIQGRRSKAEQNKYFADGKSKVQWPNSKHNVVNPDDLARAVDVAPYVGGKISWDVEQCCHFAGYVQRVADELGIKIRWGGNWDRDDVVVVDQTFNDLVHFELDER